MNMLLVRKYCHLINSKQLSKRNLLIHLWENLLRNKQNQFKIREKKQVDVLKSLESLKTKEVKSEETKPIDYDD